MSGARADDVVSDLNREALRARLGPDANLDAAVTPRDIAEAAGLPERDVVAHLRRIRAERAFSEPPRTRPSALPWLAGATLVVGLGVTWWRIHPADSTFSPAQAPSGWATPVNSTVVRSEQTTPLTTYSEGDAGPEHPPSGFQIEAIGKRTARMGGSMGEARALPYEAVRDGLVRAAVALVEGTVAQDGEAPAPVKARYRSVDGGIFSPRKGFVHLSLSGWAGTEVGWVAVPLTPAGQGDLRTMAENLLKAAKNVQDEALARVADPKAGLVSPPPGFSVRFAGRRLDVQRGPRVSFAPIPRDAIVARLEAAILNAAFRDHNPPLGPWTGNAAADAKIPQPELSRVEVMGPDGEIVVDVPTVPGREADTMRAVHDFALRAAQGIERVNRRALEKDGTADH